MKVVKNQRVLVLDLHAQQNESDNFVRHDDLARLQLLETFFFVTKRKKIALKFFRETRTLLFDDFSNETNAKVALGKRFISVSLIRDDLPDFDDWIITRTRHERLNVIN